MIWPPSHSIQCRMWPAVQFPDLSSEAVSSAPPGKSGLAQSPIPVSVCFHVAERSLKHLESHSASWFGLGGDCGDLRVISLTRVTRNCFIISRTPRDHFLLQFILCRCSRSSESITFSSLCNLLFMLHIVPRVRGNLMLLDSCIKWLKLNWQWSVFLFFFFFHATLQRI